MSKILQKKTPKKFVEKNRRKKKSTKKNCQTNSSKKEKLPGNPRNPRNKPQGTNTQRSEGTLKYIFKKHFSKRVSIDQN